MWDTYIKAITLNAGECMQLNCDDIVIFVGPNNVGKSKALNDIESLCGKTKNHNWNPEIIIQDVEIKKDDSEIVIESAKKEVWSEYKEGRYIVFGNNLTEEDIKKENEGKYYGRLKDVFMTHLRAGDKYHNNGMGLDRKTPVQHIAESSDIRKKASVGFKKAFKKDLLPHRLSQNGISLCIGDEKSLDTMAMRNSINDTLDEYKKVMDALDKVEDQSDGINSYVNTLVNLVLGYKQIYLLDEPETFLHPPQAKSMGQLIGELTESKQVFIATHSQDIVKGLLESAANRVKIIRITREGNVNKFATTI